MEFVPRYFSQSVCELLKNPDDLEILCRNNPDCRFWNAAIKEHIASRPTYNLQIGYFARKWSHRFYVPNQRGSEQTFNQLAERGNFRVSRISLCVNTILNNHHLVPDIKEFLNNLVSFIYKADLEIEIKPSYPQRFQETPPLTDALAILKDRSFQKISVRGDYLSFLEDFIVAQLDSDHLMELHLPGACADELRKKIEKSMTTIPSTSEVFPLKFEKFSEHK